MTRPQLLAFLESHPLINKAKLAGLCGVSRSMLSQVITGDRPMPQRLGEKIRVELMRYDGTGHLDNDGGNG